MLNATHIYSSFVFIPIVEGRVPMSPECDTSILVRFGQFSVYFIRSPLSLCAKVMDIFSKFESDLIASPGNWPVNFSSSKLRNLRFVSLDISGLMLDVNLFFDKSRDSSVCEKFAVSLT